MLYIVTILPQYPTWDLRANLLEIWGQIGWPFSGPFIPLYVGDALEEAGP